MVIPDSASRCEEAVARVSRGAKRERERERESAMPAKVNPELALSNRERNGAEWRSGEETIDGLVYSPVLSSKLQSGKAPCCEASLDGATR